MAQRTPSLTMADHTCLGYDVVTTVIDDDGIAHLLECMDCHRRAWARSRIDGQRISEIQVTANGHGKTVTVSSPA